SRLGFGVAAALLLGFVGLLVTADRRPARVSEPRDLTVTVDPQLSPAPQRTPPQQLVAAPAPEPTLQEPAPKAPVVETPRNPAPPRLPDEPRFALPVEPPV